MTWLSNKKLNRPEFASAVMEALQSAGFDVLETDDEEFALKGSFGTLHLTNFFDGYRKASKAGRTKILEDIVDAAVLAREHSPPADWDEAAPHLRPIVRASRFHSQLRLMARAEGRRKAVSTAHRELAYGITIELAYDTERATASVPVDQLEAWGISFEDGLRRAIDNLRQLEELRFERMPEGYYLAHGQDGYESGRMATPDIFHRLSLSGDPVVIPAIRNGLMVAGSHDDSAIEAMATTAYDLMEGHTWITFTPFQHDGDRWSRFTVPRSHRAWAPLRKLEMVELREDYDAQRNLLTRIFGADTFVPRLLLGDREGEVRSFATWGEGVTALLPEAESIVFSLLDPDDEEAYGEMFDVPFHALIEVVGHRISRIEHVEPHRWLTEGFPTREELDSLRTYVGAAPSER